MAISSRFGKSIANKDGHCFYCSNTMPTGTAIFFDNHVKRYICIACVQSMSNTKPAQQSHGVTVQVPLRNNELEALKARVVSLESQMARLSEYVRKSILNDKLEAKPKDIFDGFV